MTHIDHACLDLLMNWQRQHEANGGKLVLDCQALRARFSSEPVSATPASDSLAEPGKASGRGSRPREHQSSNVAPGDG